MVEQIEFVEEIVKLKKENPDHEIHFLSDTTGWDDENNFYGGQIAYVKLGIWLQVDERVYIDYDDIADNFWSNREFPEVDEAKANAELEEIANKAKPSILIWVS